MVPPIRMTVPIGSSQFLTTVRWVVVGSIVVHIHQSSLQDDAIDVIPIAFVNTFFGEGGVPEINLANVSSN